MAGLEEEEGLAESALVPNNVTGGRTSILGVFCPTYASSRVTSDVLGVSLTQSRAYVGGGTVWQSLKHPGSQTRVAEEETHGSG